MHPIETQTVDDAEWPLVYRQRVEAAVIDPGRRDELIISTVSDSYIPSPGEEWVVGDETELRISKIVEQDFYVSFHAKQIFSTEKIVHDLIYFRGVCTGPDERARLLFEMYQSGTANADVDDVLFIYYDPLTKAFENRVVERRYLYDDCDLEGALANREQWISEREELQTIFAELRPAEAETLDLARIKSDYLLPTRKIEKERLEQLLAEISRYQMTEEQMAEINRFAGEEYETPFPEKMIDTLAENEQWRILGVGYLEIWESWGVMLAENRSTGEWTAFYNIPQGGSKVNLFVSDDYELLGDVFSGSFCVVCDGWGDWRKFEISLDDFILRPAHK